jgi:cobalt-precorrin 5A hydrolase/precorrin-3B C17-methyltransferase
MRIVTVTVTARGAELAARLPFEHRAGHVLDSVAEEWTRTDGFVIIGATGIAVRAISPHLADKHHDPAVVSVDDAGAFVVVLAGGHAGGANDLARRVASLIGATPVISTATDLAGLPALDRLPGFSAAGDVAGVTRRWLDGAAPTVAWDSGLEGFTLPFAGGGNGGRVTVTDSDREPATGEVLLRPGSIVVGAGASTGASAAGLLELAVAGLAGTGVHRDAVTAVATADIKADEPAIVELAAALGVPLLTYPASALAGVTVPNPSPVVAGAVGTPSVAEAAAMIGAGPGGELIRPKSISSGRDATLAVARRRAPAGHLAVVGLGPGRAALRTPDADAAVRHAQTVIGYGPYVDQAADLLGPHQTVIRSPIGAEEERTRLALRRAAAGERVALVCSGDPGVYAMASLVCELAPEMGDPPVTIVAGVTAALSGAALLGAPLGHDHASISLSDLLTPWDVIVGRIDAVAAGDFVVSLYNPQSQRRRSQLPTALARLAAHRPPSTPAAVLTDIGRPGQAVLRTTLAELDPETVGMLSLVVIGSSQTRWIGGRMVTPRGYLA